MKFLLRPQILAAALFVAASIAMAAPKKPTDCQIALAQASKPYSKEQIGEVTANASFVENPFVLLWQKINGLWERKKRTHPQQEPPTLADKQNALARLNHTVEYEPPPLTQVVPRAEETRSAYTLTFSSKKSFIDASLEEVYRNANLDLNTLDWKYAIREPKNTAKPEFDVKDMQQFSEAQAKAIRAKRVLLAAKSEDLEDHAQHDPTLLSFFNGLHSAGLPVMSLENIRGQLYSQYRQQDSVLPHVLDELIQVLDYAIRSGDSRYSQQLLQDAQDLKKEVDTLRKKLTEADKSPAEQRLGQLLLRSFGSSLIGRALAKKYTKQEGDKLVWDFKKLKADLYNGTLNKLLILSQSDIMNQILLSKIFTHGTLQKTQMGTLTTISDADPILRPARSIEESENFYRDGMPRKLDLMRIVSGDMLAYEYREIQRVEEVVYNTPRIVTKIVGDKSGSMADNPDPTADTKIPYKSVVRDALTLGMLARAYSDAEEKLAEHSIGLYLFNTEVSKVGQMDNLSEFEKKFIEIFYGGYPAEGGTQITNAIVTSLLEIAAEEKEKGVAQFANIILVTDGEDNAINLEVIRKAKASISKETQITLHCINLGVANPALQALMHEFGGKTEHFAHLSAAEMQKLRQAQIPQIMPEPEATNTQTTEQAKMTNLILNKSDMAKITSFSQVMTKIEALAKSEITVDYQMAVGRQEILTIQDRLAAFLNKLRFSQTNGHQTLGKMRLALFPNPEEKIRPLEVSEYLQDYTTKMLTSLENSFKITSVEVLLPNERAELLEKGLEEIAHVIGVRADHIIKSMSQAQKSTFYEFLRDKK